MKKQSSFWEGEFFYEKSGKDEYDVFYRKDGDLTELGTVIHVLNAGEPDHWDAVSITGVVFDPVATRQHAAEIMMRRVIYESRNLH